MWNLGCVAHGSPQRPTDGRGVIYLTRRLALVTAKCRRKGMGTCMGLATRSGDADKWLLQRVEISTCSAVMKGCIHHCRNGWPNYLAAPRRGIKRIVHLWKSLRAGREHPTSLQASSRPSLLSTLYA